MVLIDSEINDEVHYVVCLVMERRRKRKQRDKDGRGRVNL